MIRRFLTLAAVAVFATSAFAQTTYSLPQTCLSFEVTARQTVRYAGPYAKYAEKYLGVTAAQEDQSSFQIVSVRMTPFVEADQSKRFVFSGSKTPDFLTLTSQGLISTGEAGFGSESVWRFPARKDGDFSQKGVSSNFTSEATTLYKNVKNEDVYTKVAIQQDMVVEKSLDAKAREAADMIFDLRKKRVQIVTGDTDATFSGEALAAAVAEISKLEKEYMSLFIGYTETQEQTMKFDIVPSAANQKQIYIAFRLSDNAGLVASDNIEGKPYILELKPQAVSDAPAVAAGKGQMATYRIPAICELKLSDGVNTLLRDRVPVYQLGKDATFMVNSK
ncbi:MAG: DUF4831 family protein [Bacteroidales bacterium]|nr:DUF4831 family protein [Bacteroidales bacterium]